jgi:hypothetical protein
LCPYFYYLPTEYKIVSRLLVPLFLLCPYRILDSE